MLSASPRRSGALALATTMLPVVESSALATPRPTISAMRPPGVVTKKNAAIVATSVYGARQHHRPPAEAIGPAPDLRAQDHGHAGGGREEPADLGVAPAERQDLQRQLRAQADR